MAGDPSEMNYIIYCIGYIFSVMPFSANNQALQKQHRRKRHVKFSYLKKKLLIIFKTQNYTSNVIAVSIEVKIFFALTGKCIEIKLYCDFELQCLNVF